MSRINDLIAEYCPNGVEYRELAELVDYQQPSPYIVSSTNYDDSFSLPVLTAGQSFILGYSDDDQGIFYASAERPVIIFDDFTTSFHWVDFDFKVKSSAIKMLRIKPDVDCSFRYVYYAMSCIQYVPKEHSRQWISIYSTFKIPVPPLPVQEEIVRILDSFSSLEAELEAELEARRKQYAYYRNELLTFERVVTVCIQDICIRICSGGTPASKRHDYYDGNVPWLRTQDIDFNVINQTSATISDEGLRNSAAQWIPANCVIVAMYGATAAKVAVNSIPLTTNQACCNLQIDETKADARYVFHWLSNEYEHLKALGEGSQSNINAKKVKSYPISLPPLEEQRRIVSILDRFDKLTNDLSSGLPAEIEARRKQYEYYRDRLLSFDELAV